jgi:hypothetical protein
MDSTGKHQTETTTRKLDQILSPNTPHADSYKKRTHRRFAGMAADGCRSRLARDTKPTTSQIEVRQPLNSVSSFCPGSILVT